MTRTYFSLLGTNDYLACNYCKPGYATIFNVRFVQEATINWFCSGWGRNDQIVILTTEEAHRKNWQDNGHVCSETSERLKRQGLHSRLKAFNPAPTIREAPVPTGQSEEEIWTIFETIFQHIGEGDEVVMDITHAFRSMPMLAVVVLNYAKVMKKITVGSISYGAMESFGTRGDIRKMPLEERNVPVFDLTARRKKSITPMAKWR